MGIPVLEISLLAISVFSHIMVNSLFWIVQVFVSQILEERLRKWKPY
jgi:hypothetical protein